MSGWGYWPKEDRDGFVNDLRGLVAEWNLEMRMDTTRQGYLRVEFRPADGDRREPEHEAFGAR